MRAPPESLRPMTGAPFPHRQIHDLYDLFQRTTRRVIRRKTVKSCGEHIDKTAIDLPVTRDDAIRSKLLRFEAKIGGAVIQQSGPARRTCLVK